MSESFSEPGPDVTEESDVAGDDDQVEAGSDDEFVGRVAGADEGYSGEQGAEARAADTEDR
jgi:hypothetical protein